MNISFAQIKSDKISRDIIADTPDRLDKLVTKLEQMPPTTVISWAIAYDFSRDPISINPQENIAVLDLPSIQPRALTLVTGVMADTGFNWEPYVITFKPLLLASIEKLLSLPFTFAGFELKIPLYGLWKLGLPTPAKIWDCQILERASTLGQYHSLYFRDEAKLETQTNIEAKEAKEDRLSLIRVCQEYNIPLLCFPEESKISCSVSNALTIARASAEIYFRQLERHKDDYPELLTHCREIEMPWLVVNAAMSWRGVLVDYKKADNIRTKIEPALSSLLTKLAKYGISNPRSANDIKNFLIREKLANPHNVERFSFDGGKLKSWQHLHPAFSLILKARKLADILSNKTLDPAFAVSDGRGHPIHTQLGAETGRQSCSLPNVAGLSRWLKPIIIPASGSGIGEADWSQIEPGIAGVIYGDSLLIKMYNSGDVYVAMAKHCFRDSLSGNELSLDNATFKKKFPHLRDKMKACTLGMIYGMTPYGIATGLNIPIAQAEELLNTFETRFPQLAEGCQRQRNKSINQPYCTTINGLRRYKGIKRTAMGDWFRRKEGSWFVNYPVQGSAAVVFKAAGVRIYQECGDYDAHLLIPVHDAFVFEAPLSRLEETAQMIACIMKTTLKDFFPDLEPRVDINIQNPQCWNKDGLLGFRIDENGEIEPE